MYKLIVGFCFISAVCAQTGSTIFQDVTATQLPILNNLGTCSAVSDLDNDGDLDIVLGTSPFGPGWSGQTKLFINDGNGYYTEESLDLLPRDSADANDVILGDIDNDGDLDLFITNRVYGSYGRGQDNLYLNDGFAQFSNVSDRLPQADVLSIGAVFSDVNGDNALDLIVAHDPPQLLLNDGTGHFTDHSITHIPIGVDTLNIYKFLPADVDGDWDLDLIVINAWNPDNFYYQHEEIWVNDGNGIFTRRVVLLQSAPDDPGLNGDVFDLNGDGILDLIVAQVFQNELYLSTGQGQYENVSITHLPVDYRTSAIQFGDVNCDGLVDLVLANGTYADQLFINTGDANFIDSTTVYLPEIPQSSSRSVNLFDTDGDGDLDVHFGSTGDGQNRLLLNTGSEQDMIPPVLRHDEEAATWQDTSGQGHLRVFVSDASRWIAKVTLLRYDSEGDIDTIAARPVGGDLHQATVDSQMACATWQYCWVAEDRVGNQTRLPVADETPFTWIPQPVNTIRGEPISNFQIHTSVYPNPFNSQLQIRITTAQSIQLHTLTLTLTNLLGQVVEHKQVEPPHGNTFSLSWSQNQSASGIYFLTVMGQSDDNSSYISTKKVVLVK